jgi:iron complex transport system substrate-binding protein
MNARLRWVVGLTALAAACAALAGPLLRPIRGALVGARGFADTRVEGAAFPKRLVDPAGRAVVLPRPPQRIVSGYLASDELLAALVDRSRVAAASVFADDRSSSNCLGAYPPPIARVRGEAEEILALHPDLVFITNFTEDGTVRLLAGAGVPLVRFTDWDSFAGIAADIRLTGAAVAAEAAADALAASVERRVRAVTERARGLPRPRVLFYELPGFTRGAGSLVDEMIERAGGQNVAREAGIKGAGQIGIESILALAPDVIVFPVLGSAPVLPASVAASPGWTELPAVRAGRVHVVPSATVTSVSQHAARGLEAMAHIIHPEVFAPEPASEPAPAPDAR